MIKGPEKQRALRAWQHLKQSAHARAKARRTILEGVHLLQAYQAVGAVPWCWFLDLGQAQHPEIQALCVHEGWPEPFALEGREFEHLSGLQSPVGVAALIDWPVMPKQLPQREACLVLDRVQDPGNVGTLIRSAVAVGMNHVLLSRGSAQAWSPKVLRAAMGSHFAVTLHEEVDLPPWMDHYQGRIYGALLEQGQPYDEVVLDTDLALVIGHEGSGLCVEVIRRLHGRLTIPMTQAVESLNAAVAGSVLLFEWQRQQRHGGAMQGG